MIRSRFQFYVEFMALRLLLKYALERNLTHIQIYGDSSLVTNWMKKISQLQNFPLKTIGDHLKDIEKSFVAISFAHVYKDFNRKNGKLCKEGQLLVEFTTVVEEVREGVSISSLINF